MEGSMDRGPYVTQRLPQLQSFRMLPVAALFAITSAFEALAWVMPGVRLPHAGRWFFAGLLVALAASYPIGAWYGRHYSRTTQRLRDSQLWPLTLGVACVILSMSIQAKAALPFSLPPAVAGLLLAGFGVTHYAFRRHYVAAGAVFGLVAFLRPLGV